MISIPVPLSPVASRLAVLVSATAALLGFGLTGTGTAAGLGVGIEDEPRILAVQFDLASPVVDGDAGPLSASTGVDVAHYAVLQVDHGGVARRLRPLAGPVTARPTERTGAVAVDIDGLRVGSAAEGFEADLTSVFASASLSQFARIETDGLGPPAAIDLRLSRALGPGDYVLVQDAGGDDQIELQSIDADGVANGPTLVVGPPYRWNSGHRTASGSSQWTTVVEAPTSSNGSPVVGLRIRAAQADVKVLVLEPATDEADAASPLPDPTPDPTGDTTPAPPPTVPATVQPPALDDEPMAMPTEPASIAEQPMVVTVPGPNQAAQLADQPTAVPVEPAPITEQPMVVAVPGPNQAAQLVDPELPAPATLAMTGVSTEPWILVALATGFIFFGYTTVAAFRRPKHRPGPGEPRGHTQLDALGFD